MSVRGVNNILRNLSKATSFVDGAIGVALGKSGDDIINHIRVNYADSRAKSGKGFTSRTHILEKSLRKEVVSGKASEKLRVLTSTEYAPDVEWGHGGKFRFLYPAVIDMKPDIIKNLKTIRGRYR